MAKPEKFVRFVIKAEIEVPTYFEPDFSYIDHLIGHWVKVKSGDLENIAMGVITEAEFVEQKTPRKDAHKR